MDLIGFVLFHRACLTCPCVLLCVAVSLDDHELDCPLALERLLTASTLLLLLLLLLLAVVYMFVMLLHELCPALHDKLLAPAIKAQALHQRQPHQAATHVQGLPWAQHACYSADAQPSAYSSHPCCLSDLQAWIEEVSAFVKAADPNHLVTVGEEGFYGPGSPDLGSNPSPGLCTLQVLTRL